MAKVKSMNNRNLIGTLGGAVYYMRAGENVAREKAAFVTNPRSTSQMNQRVRLANLVNFYRANRSWMFRGAFENKPAKWSDYNAFVSRNIQTSDVALTKAEANAGAVIADAYQVTDGSLPQIRYTVSASQLSIPLAGALAGDNGSIDKFRQLITQDYPGIREGDQISIIVLINKRDASGTPRLEVYPNEFILASDDTDTVADNINVAGHDVTTIFVQGFWRFTIVPQQGESISFVVCASRTTSGGIKVSPSWVGIGNDTFVTGYSSVEQFQKAIDSYGDSLANFLDSSSAVAGDSNTPSGDDDQGGSGSGDPGDVEP